MKRIALLGSTGSIGRQSLDVVESHPDRFEVVALAAGGNVALAAQQVSRHKPKIVSVATEQAARELAALIHDDPQIASIEILFGAEGMEAVATHPDVETVVSAAVGVVGLPAQGHRSRQQRSAGGGRGSSNGGGCAPRRGAAADR
jgi:1-deoxy-D-xylulose-5-phosphate reductoisomerase